MLRLLSIAMVALSVSAAAGAFGEPSPQPRETETTTRPLSSPQLTGSFSLIDQYGVRRTDKAFRGKYMLVFFGYTSCPDICPVTLAVEADALDKLGARARRITPIFISLDPQRDTPDKLRSYLTAFDANPTSARPKFVGLTGSEKEISTAAKAYHVEYRTHLDARGGAAGYSVDHTSNVYLMSPEGKFIAYYSAGIRAAELASDLAAKVR